MRQKHIKRQILDYLKEHGQCTPMDLAQFLNMNINTANSNLARLLKEGVRDKAGYGIYTLKKK